MVEEEAKLRAENDITAYGIPLTPAPSFKYLGRVLLAVDDKWPSFLHNLVWAHNVWVWMAQLLGRE